MLESSRGRRRGRWLLPVAVTVACTSLWLVALSGTASAAGVSGYHVVSATQSVAAGQGGTASATCPSGDVVLSGGYQVSDSTPGALNYWGSAPTLANNSLSSTTWSAGIGNNTTATQSVTAYAVCVSSSIAGYAEESQFFSMPAGAAIDGNLACPAGEVAVGGGWLGGPGFVLDSDPSKSSTISSTNWDVSFDGSQSGATGGTVYAICISNSVSGFSDQLNQTFTAGTISQSCPAGQVAIGGGFDTKNPSMAAPVDANGALSTSTWSVTNANPSGGVVGVVTICADALPTVSFLKPTSGAAAGGTTVTVVGNGLSGATKVLFGNVAATRFSVTSDTQINAVAPAGTGTVDVTVVSPGGTSAISTTDRYTYLPSVAGVSPSSGPPAGGTAVTITGVGFTNATAVNFGSIPATQFKINSDTSISATAPAGAGAVDVTVTTPTSTSQSSAADQFSYVPSVTGVSPSSGGAGGGTSVTITGTGFVAGSTTVAFGTNPATNVVVVNATTITANAPAGIPGTVEVRVRTPGGTSGNGADQTFTTLPSPPSVTTGAASAVSETTATLNASVNPNGGNVTSCQLQWGTSTAYGSTAACTPSPGSGTSAVAVSAGASGLTPNTTYHFRIVATNAGGPSNGADQTFTTLPNPPTVTTGAASGISQTAATLSGTVNPNGGNITSCQLQWGTTTAYGNTVSCSPSPGSGTSPAAVSGAATGLAPNTAYHFRVVATNAGGPSNGADQTFTTLPGPPPTQPATQPTTQPATQPATAAAPVVTPATLPAAPSVTSAVLSGTVNPENLQTTAHFELGLDPSYGAAADSGSYTISTPAIPVGADASNHAVSAQVTGLVPSAHYHVRLVATNTAGTATGPDQTFMTQAAPPPPPPVLGQAVDVKPVSGIVLIKPPPGKSLGHAPDAHVTEVAKGQGFVPLTQARQIPTGSSIDATRGSLEITSATGQKGKNQNGTFGGALFQLTQLKSKLSKGLTTLSLLEGTFRGAPTYASCPKAAADRTATTARLSSRVLQTLRASEHGGRYSTRGRYSAATVRGTAWDTIDRCDGTLTIVHRGIVSVQDLVHHKTITLHAGQSYLARAAQAQKRGHK